MKHDRVEYHTIKIKTKKASQRFVSATDAKKVSTHRFCEVLFVLFSVNFAATCLVLTELRKYETILKEMFWKSARGNILRAWSEHK